MLPFEHVVIDEAQDVSPLEFLLLYLQSSNKSFTILGDIEQRLLPHRGITSWREVKPVFSGENPQHWDARISYRSTLELTKYANRILKLIAPKTARAIPYKRHGENPTLKRSKSYADMVLAIAEDIRFLRTQGMQTIAVLCKTSSESSRLLKELRKAGIDDAVSPDQKSYERTKTTVSSVFPMKGVEFDAVILSNARKNNYDGSDLHNRILYIAVTRAAHVLHIHWFGAIADALADPALLPKTKQTKGRSKPKKRLYRSSVKFAITIEQDENGVFVASCPALPGCYSQGKTRKEAIANVTEAIKGYIASMRKHGEPVPQADIEEVEVKV